MNAKRHNPTAPRLPIPRDSRPEDIDSLIKKAKLAVGAVDKARASLSGRISLELRHWPEQDLDDQTKLDHLVSTHVAPLFNQGIYSPQWRQALNAYHQHAQAVAIGSADFREPVTRLNELVEWHEFVESELKGLVPHLIQNERLFREPLPF